MLWLEVVGPGKLEAAKLERHGILYHWFGGVLGFLLLAQETQYFVITFKGKESEKEHIYTYVRVYICIWIIVEVDSKCRWQGQFAAERTHVSGTRHILITMAWSEVKWM